MVSPFNTHFKTISGRDLLGRLVNKSDRNICLFGVKNSSGRKTNVHNVAVKLDSLLESHKNATDKIQCGKGWG